MQRIIARTVGGQSLDNRVMLSAALCFDPASVVPLVRANHVAALLAQSPLLCPREIYGETCLSMLMAW